MGAKACLLAERCSSRVGKLKFDDLCSLNGTVPAFSCLASMAAISLATNAGSRRYSSDVFMWMPPVVICHAGQLSITLGVMSTVNSYHYVIIYICAPTKVLFACG